MTYILLTLTLSLLSLKVAANDATMQSVARGSSDLIGRLPNDNQVNHNDVNNIINGANANVSINTLTNDVRTIARFLMVNEADNVMRSIAAESICDALMKALEEIAELKRRVADLEAQMRSEMND